MSLLNPLYKFVGSLHPSVKWKFGKVRVVFACDYTHKDFKGDGKVWKVAYKNPVCILKAPDSPQMKSLLSDLTLSDKLIIQGHASPSGMESISQNDLIERLLQYGLKEVGVIKFHACEIGSKNYLYTFSNKLKMKGVAFSWISGPVGYYVSLPFARFGSAGGYYNKMSVLRRGEITVVKGNRPGEFKGTRYTE